MMIEEQSSSDDEGRRVVKVKIPVKHHIWLHTQKTLEGTNISTAVTEALDQYFEDRPDVTVDDEAQEG